MEKPKVVILCGGIGTRLREQTEFMPKPLVRIGDMPILWHIMKIYSHYGYNDFILCLGYKGEMIKEYFLNYEWMSRDFTFNLSSRNKWKTHSEHALEDWNITFADTGLHTLTGGRIKKIEKYIKGDYFLATYGDGVADVDIKKLVKFHREKRKSVTLTGLHPISRYGIIKAKEDGLATSFSEKPALGDLINGGFFVFNRRIFDYLNKDIMLEEVVTAEGPLATLAKEGQLAVFRHTGFWHCMDTYRDYAELNRIWDSKKVPWKVWE